VRAAPPRGVLVVVSVAQLVVFASTTDASAALLAFASCALLGGRVCDLIGPRLGFGAGLASFAIALVLSGSVRSHGMLVTDRILQGLSAAVLSAAALKIITTCHRGNRLPAAISVWTATVACGVAIGSVLSGPWRLVLFASVPIGAGVLLAVIPAIPVIGTPRPRGSPDLPGAMVGMAGVGIVGYGISEAPSRGWISVPTLIVVFVGVHFLLAFAGAQRFGANPVLSRTLWRKSSLVIGSGGMLGAAAVGTVSVYLAKTLIDTVRYPPVVMTGVEIISMAAAAHVGPAIIRRAGTRWGFAAGVLVAAHGSLLLGLAGRTSYWSVPLAGLVLLGLGIGLAFGCASLASMSGVRPEQTGAAAGLFLTALGLGTVLGIALASATSQGVSQGFFATSVVGLVLAAAGALTMPAITMPASRTATQKGTGMTVMPADPYRLYAEWRGRSGGVHWADPPGHWFVLSYADARTALNDHRLVSPSGEAKSFDIPDVERFRPRLERIAHDILDRAGNRMDAIGDFATPFARATAALVLGVPAEDEMLNIWVDRLTGELAAPMGHCRRLSSGDSRPVGVPADVADVLREFSVARDPEELAEFVVAIHHTAIAAIGNGIRALLDHPAQYRMLRKDSGLASVAVQELLRFDPPVQMVARRATTTLKLGQRTIEPDQVVMIVLAAANRDPGVFSDPDVLELSRDPNPHLTFGTGVRHCPGTLVAVLAAEVALTALAAHFPVLRGNGNPEPSQVTGGRALRHLPIALAVGKPPMLARISRTLKAMHGMG
jgi:cytochrome P450/MFS family permease